MSGFVLRGLDPAPFAPLFALDDDALEACDARRVVATSKPGFPCRVSLVDAEPGEALIGFGRINGDFNLSPSGDLAEAAANLFSLLRAADARTPSGIAIAPVPTEGLGEAINDRLARAAGYIG